MQRLARPHRAVLLLGLLVATPSAVCAATSGSTVTLPAAVAEGSAAASAEGSAAASLVAALRDPSVNHIVLTANYAVGDEFQPYLVRPLAVTRWVAPAAAPPVGGAVPPSGVPALLSRCMPMPAPPCTAGM